MMPLAIVLLLVMAVAYWYLVRMILARKEMYRKNWDMLAAPFFLVVGMFYVIVLCLTALVLHPDPLTVRLPRTLLVVGAVYLMSFVGLHLCFWIMQGFHKLRQTLGIDSNESAVKGARP